MIAILTIDKEQKERAGLDVMQSHVPANVEPHRLPWGDHLHTHALHHVYVHVCTSVKSITVAVLCKHAIVERHAMLVESTCLVRETFESLPSEME